MATENYGRFFEGLYNVSGFDGTIESDFLKLAVVPENKKADLIDYNLKGFDDYRLALQNYLKAVYPLDYNNFASSDLGQMLIELFAYQASVLALRADMTANEMYIDTVKNEDNLKRLLQLIGVRMKGPTASKATGQLDLPNDASVSQPIVIQDNARTLDITNQRTGTPLTYTIYRQQSDGSLNLWEKDMTIPWSDFVLEGGVSSVTNLLLLEGVKASKGGTFPAGARKQTITLTDGPIIEGSIGVSSNEGAGVLYNEISNLFVASGGGQTVFEKQYTGGFGAILTFGDGVRGKMPQPGSTYVVTYRTGGGVNGDIVRGNLNKQVGVLQGGTTVQATVTNTTKGSGGNPAESVAHAKQYAPYFFRTQYRAVTGEDYNTLANSFTGRSGQTAKAMVSLRKNGAAANVIDLFLLTKASPLQLERASVAFKKELLDYFQNYKMLTDEIVISDGVVRTLDLVCTIFIDKSNRRIADNIKQKAANALTTYFNVDNMNFGVKLSIADVTNHMLTVPEVRFFNVDNLEKDVFVNFNEIVQLNNFEFNIELV
jgi:hypothetical protein